MSNLVPFGHFGSMDIGRAFGMGDLFRNMFDSSMGNTFRVDVRDNADSYEIIADLPGLHREMINVEYNEGILTISANMDSETQADRGDYVVHERRQGTVSRSFSVKNVKEDDITAAYRDGVLSVILPKGKDTDDSSRRIQID